jgi:hypothetical protein
VFRRSSSGAAGPKTVEDDRARRADAADAARKGKATPKRRDAQARRRTSVIAQGGGTTGRRSGESRGQYAQRREAIRRGDENALPARDRGPARRFARDVVDSRRNVASLFMPVGLPIILLSYTGIGIFQLLGIVTLWAFVVGVGADSIVLTRKIRREVAVRFPGESTRGLGFYAITRALQFRRMRLPKPRVSRGARI